MSRRRQIYEGKAKILYEGPEPGTIIQYFKDDATAFNAQKKGTINGKGVINNRISEHVFLRLAHIGIPTHFIRRLNMREQLVRQVEIIPLEGVVRNVAAGSISGILSLRLDHRRSDSGARKHDRPHTTGCARTVSTSRLVPLACRSGSRLRIAQNVAAGSISKRLGIEEGEPLPHTLIEYYLKSDELQDPMVAEEHIACFGWANNEEMQDIAAMAIRVNDFMCGMFAAIGIRLIDFKLEFGRIWDGDYARVILADEISPDNCRLWDITTNEKLDKDRFRRDLGGEEEAYQEVARRLGLLNEDSGPGEVFDLSAHRTKLRGTPKPKK